MGSGAPLKVQANALMRKSLTLQKRNVGGNCCLILAPVLLLIILGALQVVIDSLLKNNKDLHCGCQCTECCNIASGVCAVSSSFCNEDGGEFTCRTTNSSNCGIQYSTASQAAFCPVPWPSVWPPVMQTPEAAFRAGRDHPPPNGTAEPQGAAAVMMVTGASPTLAGGLSAAMFQQLQSPAAVKAILDDLVGQNALMLEGQLLSVAGFVFGTDADLQNSVVIEGAFTSRSDLYAMLPYPTCLQRNLTTPNMPLDEFVYAYYGLPYNRTGGSSSRSGVATPVQSRVTCVDAPIAVMANTADVQRALYCGYKQSRCNGTPSVNEFSAAWDWQMTTQSNLQLTIMYNGTMATEDEKNRQGIVASRLPELLNLAVRSWYQYYTGDNTQPLQLLGIQSMPMRAYEYHLDFSSLLGPLFFTWIVQLLLPTILQQLVYEKEKRLRMMMKMHGLGDGAYWLMTYMWYFILYSIYITVYCVIGAIVRLKMFPYTSVGIQIIFYFLFGNCMIAFAFMLSSLFSSSRTAVTVAFLYVFATGLIGQLLFQTFMDKGAKWVFFVEWVPAWALYRGLYEMAAYTFLAVYRGEKKGMQFSDLNDPNNGMLAVWGILLVEWFLFMLLAYYFEQVLSDNTGIRRHWLFFLQRKKTQEEQARNLELSAVSVAASSKSDFVGKSRAALINVPENNDLGGAGGEREDVEAERKRVMALTDLSDHPIVMRDVRKIFPGQDGGPPKLAVKTLTMAVERGECFGLLGPNGAGKSTSINMLVGFLEPTSGTALVEGLDIKTEMNLIYNKMGVCPQHDLLWDTMTGREHLLFYGRLKGLKGDELDAAVEAGLRSVNLWLGGLADKHSAKYSGGMKRRLSVAISFIGAPNVVYLDEPSTGLDPASRRNLWEVVKGNKAGRATILTTHSMEEAEMLCDRLGIFVDGQLVCIGAPKEITNRYAGYLVFQIMVPNGEEGKAQQVVLSMSPSARLTYGLGGTMKYELPTTEVTLSKVFNEMGRAKAAGLNILDWGVANATLEEVFIKFARTLGAETKE